MIVNIFDMRADHMAADPLDAAVVGFESRIDRNGVTVIDTNWQDTRMRKDLSLTDSIAWASAKSEPVALMLFDATSRCSRLAEFRMDVKGACDRILDRLGISYPVGGVEFIDEDDSAAETASRSDHACEEGDTSQSDSPANQSHGFVTKLARNANNAQAYSYTGDIEKAVRDDEANGE